MTLQFFSKARKKVIAWREFLKTAFNSYQNYGFKQNEAENRRIYTYIFEEKAGPKNLWIGYFK